MTAHSLSDTGGEKEGKKYSIQMVWYTSYRKEHLGFLPI